MAPHLCWLACSLFQRSGRSLNSLAELSEPPAAGLIRYRTNKIRPGSSAPELWDICTKFNNVYDVGRCRPADRPVVERIRAPAGVMADSTQLGLASRLPAVAAAARWPW